MSTEWDAIVVGAGHNGLVCAALLARRGRSVLVLEAAPRVGGAAVTRAFAPGHRVGAGAHLLYGFSAALVRELELERHGLKACAQNLPTCALSTSGPALELGAQAVLGVPDADGRAYAAFRARMDRFARLLDRLHATTPFRPSLPTTAERWAALGLALRLRLLGRRDMQDILRIGAMNAYDLLTEHFASPLLQGALAMDAVLGAEYAARSPGTVLTLLHRWACQGQAWAGGLAQVEGGVGALTQALAASAAAAGALVRTEAAVRRVLVEGDRACGVELASGETLRARSVVSNADPRTTFLRLVGPEHLDTDFVRRIDHFRARGLVAKVHLALAAAPRVNGLGAGRLGARLLVAPSLDYLELAYNPSKYRELPAEPALEIHIPSVHDASLAPPGRHVMSINVLFVPYELGPDPQAARACLLANVLAVLERHAPGIGSLVTASEVLMPQDLEREFGMCGGHWHHGALGFDQFFFARPVPGATRYATPLPGLFLCGAGCHPGGGVTGLAGRNAARVILAAGASA